VIYPAWREFPELPEGVGELLEVDDEAVEVAVTLNVLAVEDTDAIPVSVLATPDAVPVTVPVLVSLEFELEDEVLLSPATPQTSCNLVQPVANSPAHQSPLDISQ
jgi:hypothetical protein